MGVRSISSAHEKLSDLFNIVIIVKWAKCHRERGATESRPFFVYLHANCTGAAGTAFPVLTRPAEKFWCRFVECKDNSNTEASGNATGVTFKPIPGNAVFGVIYTQMGEGMMRLGMQDSP